MHLLRSSPPGVRFQADSRPERPSIEETSSTLAEKHRWRSLGCAWHLSGARVGGGVALPRAPGCRQLTVVGRRGGLWTTSPRRLDIKHPARPGSPGRWAVAVLRRQSVKRLGPAPLHGILPRGRSRVGRSCRPAPSQATRLARSSTRAWRRGQSRSRT